MGINKTHKIAAYRIIVVAGRASDQPGDNDRSEAAIDLFDENGNICGRVSFKPEGSTLDDPKYNPNSEQIVLYYHRSQFPAIVDILRNEDPINIYYSSSPIGYLFTGVEPVGEEEASRIP